MDSSQQVVTTTTTTATTATIPPATQAALGQVVGSVEVDTNTATAAKEQAIIKEAIDQELNEASALSSSIEGSGQQQQQQSTNFHPMDTNQDGYIEQAEIDAASSNTFPSQQQQQSQNTQTTSSGAAMDSSQQVVTTTNIATTATIPPETQAALGQVVVGSVEVDTNTAAAVAEEQAIIQEAIDQELNEASALSSSIEGSGQHQQQQQQQQQIPTFSPITLWEEWSSNNQQQSGGGAGTTANTDDNDDTDYHHPNINETAGWGDLNAWDNGRTDDEGGGVFDRMEDYVFGQDDPSNNGIMRIQSIMTISLLLYNSMMLLLV